MCGLASPWANWQASRALCGHMEEKEGRSSGVAILVAQAYLGVRYPGDSLESAITVAILDTKGQIAARSRQTREGVDDRGRPLRVMRGEGAALLMHQPPPTVAQGSLRCLFCRVRPSFDPSGLPNLRQATHQA